MSRRLDAASRFLRDGRMKSAYQRALDAVNPYDRRTDLPKDPMGEALDAASKVDPATGLPRTP